MINIIYHPIFFFKVTSKVLALGRVTVDLKDKGMCVCVHLLVCPCVCERQSETVLYS